jgi:Family of unknown function (DUF6350)
MFQRVLGVTLVQVVRSISLVLLPIAFLSLIAWATAGSTNGNTSDPIRAAVWLWLGAHHLAFNLTVSQGAAAGWLTYLPLGALIFPIMAMRSGFKRSIERLDSDYQSVALARTLFVSLYAILTAAIAFFVTTDSIKPVWYLTPLITIPIATISVLSAERRKISSQPIYLATRILAALLGVAFLVLGVSLLVNLGTVKNLTQVLQPGILGGLLLLILNILYLPNAAVAAIGYFAGVGFGVGTGTMVAPLSYRVPEIPALPILGALPTGKFQWALIAILLFVAAGVALTSWTLNQRPEVLWQSFTLILIAIGFICWAASGSLMTAALSAVGVSIWKVTLAVGTEMAIGIGLARVLPRLERSR